jgi:tryptophan synthase alpha chain
MTPASRISRLFDALRPADAKALIGYLTAGDPSLQQTPSLVAALARGGVDMVELGVPFSDPIADGAPPSGRLRRAPACAACSRWRARSGGHPRSPCCCSPT